MDGPLGDNILIIPNEINLLPHVAEETVDAFLAEVNGAVEPIGAENSDAELRGAALFAGIESVREGGAVVPLEIVQKLAELVLYDVEIAAFRPIVPEVNEAEGSAKVYKEN